MIAGVVTQYEQVASYSMQGLTDLVNAAIEKGFQPLGGPVVHGIVMSQAIVKIDRSQGDGLAYDIHEINRKTKV